MARTNKNSVAMIPGKHFFIGGVDEAGRGPLAGPVTAAAVILPIGFRSNLVRDSKKLSETQRRKAFIEICRDAIAWQIIAVGPKRIDQLNIRRATQLAMKLAISRVCQKIGPSQGNFFFVDGNMLLETSVPHEAIIKGDSFIHSVSAASILAKVSRDFMMERIHQRFPFYGFSQHKGYPTKIHRERIQEFGPCEVHRTTFAGVRECLEPSSRANTAFSTGKKIRSREDWRATCAPIPHMQGAAIDREKLALQMGGTRPHHELQS